MNMENSNTAYEKTIQINKELGLVPSKPRYSVVGDGYYGVYDDYYQMKKDTKNLNDAKIIKEPHGNAWKATQKCYSNTFKGGPCRYILEPIKKANTIIRLKPVGRLFERI